VLGERACRATRLELAQAATSSQVSSGVGIKMDLTSGVRMSVRYMRKRGEEGQTAFLRMHFRPSGRFNRTGTNLSFVKKNKRAKS
jgi:hypothetical protein